MIKSGGTTMRASMETVWLSVSSFWACILMMAAGAPWLPASRGEVVLQAS